MFKNFNRKSFIFGLAVGSIGIGIIGKKIKKILGSKITIIQIDIPKNLETNKQEALKPCKKNTIKKTTPIETSKDEEN